MLNHLQLAESRAPKKITEPTVKEGFEAAVLDSMSLEEKQQLFEALVMGEGTIGHNDWELGMSPARPQRSGSDPDVRGKSRKASKDDDGCTVM